jgi:putative cell wall-binding protein
MPAHPHAGSAAPTHPTPRHPAPRDPTPPNPVEPPPSRGPVRTHVLAAALAVLLAVSVVAVPFATSARADELRDIDRVAGEDRIATAVAGAQRSFSSAAHAVLTTAEDYPDALAAAAYAAANDAPILLSTPASLPAATAEELSRLGVEHVTLLGGEDTLSADVESAVAELVGSVERIGGQTRFETAQTLAEQVGAGQGGRVAVALGAGSDGQSGWPDALSAGTLAGLTDPVPTLLTASDELPPATRDALEDLQPAEVLVVGGERAVSDPVVAELASYAPSVERIAGSNRYETSVAVAGVAHAAGLPQQNLVFASGEGFVDALGAAAVAAEQAAPMVLVPSDRLDDSVDVYLRDGNTSFGTGIVLGGPSAVGEHVEVELDAALRGAERPAPPAPPEPEPEAEEAEAAEPPSYGDHVFRFPLDTWDALAQCESGGNWSINTGNGYYGGIQFSLSSWRAVGGSGYPHQHSRLEQIYRGELLQARQGWGAWPSCSRKIGLR